MSCLAQLYLLLYTCLVKEIAWIGSSHDDLRNNPRAVQQAVGYQLHRVQNGLEPHDFKPMPIVGKGVIEIRIKEDNGEYRVFYVASLADCVYVLHSFRKKTQKTSDKDIAKGQKRYRDAVVDAAM